MLKTSKTRQAEKFFDYLVISLAAIPFLALIISSKKIYPAEMLMKLIFLLIAAGGLVAYLVSKRKFTLNKIPLLSIPMLGLIGLTLVGLFWAHNYFELVMNNFHWLAALCLAMLLWQWNYNEISVERWLSVFIISATFTAVIGIIQHLFEFSEIKQGAKPASVFFNRNMATQFVMAMLPITLVRFWHCKPKDNKALLFNSVAFCLMLTYIAYTQTRAAWLTLIIILLAAVIAVGVFSTYRQSLSHLKKRYLLSSMLATLVLVHFNAEGLHWFFQAVFDEANQITEAVSLENKGEARYKLFINSLHMAKENWLTGVGPGQWSVFYGDYMNTVVADDHINYQVRASKVHNAYIQIMTEYGIWGLVLVVFGLASLVTTAWSLLKNTFSYTNLGVVLSALSILTQANLSFSMHLAMPVMLLVFSLVIITKQLTNNKNFELSINKYIVLVVISGLALASSFFVMNAYTARLDYVDSRVLLRDKNFAGAYQAASKAIERNPYHKNAHVILFNSAIELDKTAEVSDKLEIALKKYPFAQELLFPAAQLTKVTQSHEKDIEYNQRLVNLFPYDAITVKRLGDAYRRAGDKVNMKLYYQKAVELDEALKEHSTIKRFLYNQK
ncbi:O-antigen ligase family protein [Kangiella sp. HZ709]|uniref:O-antigen ligase family protein n=1 Tax=Kangiella sp. HZ709 TaxID=2666328 RepID=UPI0012B0FB21|nr:O-antigen ligase family protein [Kangiella sp. HZ709]MRX27498.1 hypothetical protein [Kangiella sp. HZ709]